MGVWNFGSRIIFVALMCCGILPLVKKSWMTAYTRGHVSGQVVLKKPLPKPSGPRDLKLGIEKITSLISACVKGLQGVTCCSCDSTVPCSMISLSIGLLIVEEYPSSLV